MNYALEVAGVRQRRAAAIERARAEIVRLRAERDQEIRSLRAESPEMSLVEIGARVGCSASQVYEVLDPVKHDAYNRRRRAAWRHLKAIA